MFDRQRRVSTARLSEQQRRDHVALSLSLSLPLSLFLTLSLSLCVFCALTRVPHSIDGGERARSHLTRCINGMVLEN